jgi:hypothetical protein
MNILSLLVLVAGGTPLLSPAKRGTVSRFLSTPDCPAGISTSG